MRALWLFACAGLVTACVPRIPVQRLPSPTPVMVGYVVDPQYAGAPETAPEVLKESVNQELALRNLAPVEAPLEVLQVQKLTDARALALRQSAGGETAPFFLLIELRVQFFSQIDGRYRWEVGTALTAGRRDGAVSKDPFEVPVIVMFDHEREKQAIAYAAQDIATRVGVLMDGVLAGAKLPTPTEAPTQPAP